MYNNAKKKIQDKIYEANDWKEFMANLNKLCVVKTWWCQDKKCEDTVKERSKVESVEM